MNLIEQLKSEIDYCAETGKFRALTHEPIKYYHQPDSLVLYYRKRQYRAHRLAWVMHYGTAPKTHIVHINGDTRDNRIANLELRDYVLNPRAKPVKTDKSSIEGKISPKISKWLRVGYKVEGNHLVLEREDGTKTYILSYLNTLLK